MSLSRSKGRVPKMYVTPDGKGGFGLRTGASVKAAQGYLNEWDPVRRRYVAQHRLVVERFLGRQLEPTEIVHHKNGDRKDNRLENLQVFPSHKAHHGHHAELRKLTRKGDFPKSP